MAKRKPVEETINESDADELTRTVARNVRRIRKEKGVTIEELSEIVDVSLNTIYGWEHARHSMKTETLSKVAAALGIDPLDLVLPEGSRVIEPGARPTLPIYRIELVVSEKGRMAWERKHPLFKLEKTGGVDVPGSIAARHEEAFGYLVEDESGGLIFPKGQIVVIDPVSGLGILAFKKALAEAGCIPRSEAYQASPGLSLSPAERATCFAARFSCLRIRKKSLSTRAHSSSRTPEMTSNSWFRRLSWLTSKSVPRAPPLGSGAP